ncbi:MAG: hypothetical protein WCT05_03260 [Lentisphaeria bacterium]
MKDDRVLVVSPDEVHGSSSMSGLAVVVCAVRLPSEYGGSCGSPASSAACARRLL